MLLALDLLNENHLREEIIIMPGRGDLFKEYGRKGLMLLAFIPSNEAPAKFMKSVFKFLPPSLGGS